MTGIFTYIYGCSFLLNDRSNRYTGSTDPMIYLELFSGDES